MRDRLLIRLAIWHAQKPWTMLIMALLLTLLFAVLATSLDVTMRWSDLLPENDQRTIQFNKIIEEFVTSTSLIIVVQGEEHEIKKFAEDLAPMLLEVIDTTRNNLQLAQRVDYKSDIEFLKQHGLLLIKEDDLCNIHGIFTDPNLTVFIDNLNDALEKEYVGQSESISTREKEDGAVALLRGIENLVAIMLEYANTDERQPAEVQKTIDKFLYGEPYFLSYDNTTLILNVIPNFTMMDADMIVRATDIIQELVNDQLKHYPKVTAGLTGMIAVGRDEMVYSEQSLGYTSLIAIIAILLLLMLSFRMWVAPLFASINLIIGIIWAMGIVTVFVGQLNIMTSMMTVILLGLGIDFSIHIISGFSERRASGEMIHVAMENTFLKSGKGVITGALTTACAFLTMVISSSRGMKEMGLVTGLGLLAILLATFNLLPALLVLRERRREKKQAKTEVSPKDISFRFLGNFADRIYHKRIFTFVFALIITVILVFFAINIQFDHNYMNIEPEGLTSILLQDTIMEKFDLSMDYALILTKSPDESREFAQKYREMGSVAVTEDISLYLPSPEQQADRKPYIENILNRIKSAKLVSVITEKEWSSFIANLKRLSYNIMEMQDIAFLGGQDKVDRKCADIVGTPLVGKENSLIDNLISDCNKNPHIVRQRISELQQEFGPYFQKSVINMADTNRIQLDELPVSILDRYTNRTRELFLVTVFPAGNIWQDAQFLDHFVEDLEKVTDKATGFPPVFRALIEIIGKDGRNAVLLTLIIIFLLLLLDFRRITDAFLAMIPLVFGVFWMVGLMYITGLQLTVMNIMGLPMILGIGIDDGVHIVHRWRSEGKGRIAVVFSSTGKAILLTSLTTMLAFGSLIFSIWRGFGQLGSALFVGVAACFFATVIILPPIIGAIERKIVE